MLFYSCYCAFVFNALIVASSALPVTLRLLYAWKKRTAVAISLVNSVLPSFVMTIFFGSGANPALVNKFTSSVTSVPLSVDDSEYDTKDNGCLAIIP